MTLSEYKAARKLLSPLADRLQMDYGDSPTSYSITAYWLDGGQRQFWRLDHVQQHIDDTQRRRAGE